MLYLALMYCIISLACLFAGILAYALLSFLGIVNNTPAEKPLVFYAITGLIFITATGQWLVLFCPLNIFSTLAVLASLSLCCLALKKRIQHRLAPVIASLRKLSAISLGIAGILFFMILTLNAGPVIMDDTESYHIQNIKWIQEYGTVPGLANLHIRYGFNSSWFIAIGLVSPAMTGVNTYEVLNGLLSCWLCFYFIEKINPLFTGKISVLSNIQYTGILTLLMLTLFTWPMIRGNATTANYDFITTCCVVILLIESIYYSRFTSFEEWILWPFFLFTIRIINYPLLLLSVPILWQCIKEKKWRYIAGYVSIGLITTAPFLIRNVILSGYVFFPVSQIDLFAVNWKASKKVTEALASYIKYFNRVNNMHQSIEITRSYSFPSWIRLWYKYLFLYDKPVVTLSLAGYSFSILKWKVIRKNFNIHAQWMVLVLTFQLISWFFVAPDPRFAYGPLLGGIALFFVLIKPVTVSFLSKAVLKTSASILTAGCLIYITHKIVINPAYRNGVLPYPLPKPPFDVVKIDNITLKIPHKILNNQTARCYDTDLPCLYFVQPALRARGKVISDGFYLQKNIPVITTGERY
ncbi:LIC_10190 family membrane protein [Niastella populi]|uniref:DUF8201 domain-containing protein n=1 Tax=Niastella populi TaxID=550983 RepID=A0A1V9EYJ7_9BACT|nr:hypothetical protein A4R26_29510 [Niastella populi]